MEVGAGGTRVVVAEMVGALTRIDGRGGKDGGGGREDGQRDGWDSATGYEVVEGAMRMDVGGRA